MTLEASRAVADKLFAAQNSRTPIPPVREMLPADAIDLAYAAQEINTERRLKEGRRLVGRKIGLTSLAVQRQLGVDQPDYGMLFHDMAVPDGWDVASDELIQPKVEAEIAFVIGRDLDNEHLTIADILRAVEFALPAIEIVNSRISDWKIGILDTIADNASSGLYVLGASPEEARWPRTAPLRHGDGDGRRGSLGRRRRGLPRRPAVGDALARQHDGEGGRPLRAGDTVLSGALGPMVTVKRGEVYEARVSGLGSVRAAFAKEHS